VELPLISCIVPVFNGERYLREALESIFQQTYRPLEVIVVDDGSTDGTVVVAQSYGERITYVQQANAGPAAARNLGLSRVRGEFVAFLDADDLWHPEKLDRQMAHLQARPELDLCITHVQNFWARELHEEEGRLQNHRLAQPVPGYVLQTLLARRFIFDRVGQFNPASTRGSDTEWFLRAAEYGTVMELLPDVFVYRRLHQTNLSMEPHTWGMTGPSRNALVQIIKASLDRRRRQHEGALAPLQLPTSDWRKKQD
jgi:glycosyltransferase involved in cell wall biosynthesis